MGAKNGRKKVNEGLDLLCEGLLELGADEETVDDLRSFMEGGTDAVIDDQSDEEEDEEETAGEDEDDGED